MKNVKPFSYGGIDIFSLDIQELRNLIAKILESQPHGFTLDWSKER